MSELVTIQARRNQDRRTTRWKEAFLILHQVVRRRLIATTVALVGGYLLVFYTPLLWIVGEPLKIVDPPRPADVVVVLAGGVGESGRAGEGYQERVKQAVELYRSGQARRMIFSSGFVHTFREPDVMKALAVALGVPADAVILETHAKNTADNAVFVARILRQNGWHSILLVSSPYHMRRASLAFRKAAPDVRIIHAPVPDSFFYQHGVGATPRQIGGILQEYSALAYYWFTKRI